MSSGSPHAESTRGYLSEESKRRFTLVAGILGALFFVAQFLLPMVIMFLVMMPMMMGNYVLEGQERTFASLWQRALAQLVDVVPFLAGGALSMMPMWRMFSDPESLIEGGPFKFPLIFFGFFLAGIVWAMLVLIGYSYFEGRLGKTPSKWLVGIRVLGTDLRPCGFGRAFLRNLLTFVDGFLSFLVGALLVALTENWQRLGDLAARTIVVVDEKPA